MNVLQLDNTQLKYIHALAILPSVQRISDALGPDAQLCLVGGCIRDSLLGKDVHDIDLCAALSPDEIRVRLNRACIYCIPTGLKHQTVTAVPIEGKPGIEITTFRSANMNPEGGVFQGISIEEDLAYRDFTINALAYNIAREVIIGEQQGIDDIENGVIRSVDKADERFAEDPLRVLRMLRFSSQLAFKIDTTTYESAKAFALACSKVSVERIRDEFSKLLLGPHAIQTLRAMQKVGLLELLIPELADCIDFEQNRYHHKDVFEHTLDVVNATNPELILRLAALFHDIGKPPSLSVDEKGERHFYLHESIGTNMTREVLERLRYSKETVRQVCTLVQTHMRPLTAGLPGIRRILRDTEGVFDEWLALKKADASAVIIDPTILEGQLQEFHEKLEVIRSQADVSPLSMLAINGHDLIELGLTPGPQFGEILRALHEEVLDNPELNEKAILLERVQRYKVC